MKHYSFLLLLALLCCNKPKNNDESSAANGGDPSKAINDTIPLTREKVENSPIASYSEKVKDDLNDWRLAVDFYETKRTFKFLMKIEYMVQEAEDTRTIPNFGIMPKVEVRKGPEKESCIVGFLDKQGEFKEYKLIALKNKQLKISTLKYYARARYKVKK
ncbi:hypothetical protein LZD49_07300 [Dyadobacter sp. CY261]|uniref:hypothetical protein n=1 Tax=Dyadobacter sp. CY261 TaxID=2907203 RepID=UPI001F2EC896|nr:hypothetical protein [Dyadobacter sp. CY261]MCF0070272.1 hypothetical protein [Dyadobacter sp. CY261]